MDEDRDGKVLLGATCHQRGALGAAGAANHPLKAEVLLSRVVIESRTKVASGAAFIFAFLLVRTTSEASHREVSDGYEKQREQPVHQPALRHRQVPEDVREPANQGADDHIVRRVWACARTWPLRRSMRCGNHLRHRHGPPLQRIGRHFPKRLARRRLRRRSSSSGEQKVRICQAASSDRRFLESRSGRGKFACSGCCRRTGRNA
mmetsp:Transcript_50700/g.136114  ORF Transcript_50700/g.136114 Transcript_50700/m.136114 type:complete len:205 (+) Transcript_50700:297-911(+)